MEEYPLARLFRDSRLGPIGGGTSEILREIIAKMIIDGKDYKPVTWKNKSQKIVGIKRRTILLFSSRNFIFRNHSRFFSDRKCIKKNHGQMIYLFKDHIIKNFGKTIMYY